MNYEILNPNINLTENPVLLKVYLKFINNSYLENMYLNTIKSNLLMNLFIEKSKFLQVEESKGNSDACIVGEITFDKSELMGLTVVKHNILTLPKVMYGVKKTVKMSMRSFLLSLSLTFLNFFI